MAISPSPILSPLRLNINIAANLTSTSSPSLPLFNVSTRRHPTVTVCSSKGPEPGIEDKRAFLERYGLNADELLSEPSTKSKRRNEAKKGGRGKQVLEVEPTPERTTHKLLQVLAGKAKRKKLLSPKGMDVRPMMEVVKGSAFDALQAADGCLASLRPGRWLDLYSGTGSVGIEAISRGCFEVHFVEMDPWVVSNVLRPNLESTGFLDVSVIHTIRVESFLEQAEQFVGTYGTFDFISVTPPYKAVDYSILMDQISRSPLVGEDTFIVVEYPLKTNMLESCGCLVKMTDRKFGRTHLAIYGPTWAQKKRKSKQYQQSDTNGALVHGE